MSSLTPDQVTALIRTVDPEYNEPSLEQKLIIDITSNPLEPAVVIAGAGSGKTETMAARVVYLVANGLVKPEEILGLTFTRKAAGELAQRVRTRLKQLEKAMKNADMQIPFASFDATITTYHSYAAQLLSEHAIRLGIDANNQPLGEAHLWMLARDIVSNWNSDSFNSSQSADSVVKDVMRLASSMLEHEADYNDILAEDRKLIELIEGLQDSSYRKEVEKVAAVAAQRMAIMPMVAEYLAKRREGENLAFDDQIALACTIARSFDDVVQFERNRYKVVLLDEYQDTSHSQIRLLSTLFGNGHPVTAVGDPFQSIYTWRGAAAGTIGAFNSDFPKVSGQIGAAQFSLSKTYRNDTSILALANDLAAELQLQMQLKNPVKPLTTHVAAQAGDLRCGIYETREAEALAIAEFFKSRWSDVKIVKGVEKKKSFAILVRARKLIPALQSALDAVEIPYEVIGLGGLMHVPEVADIISILRVLESPDAGGALMRHLTGPRINLGPRDIVALGNYSKSIAKAQSTDSRSIVKNIIDGNPGALEADDIETGSLIEALDLIAGAPVQQFSQAGFERLTRFSADLRRLRSRVSAPLVDLILDIERYLNLEVEVALREGKGGGRRHLDKFIDEASQFVRAGGTLSGFIAWLDAAEKSERGLKASAPEPDPEVVQILTVHTAKGAEWDVVAIPGLNENTFPSDVSRDLENWLSNEGVIPFPLYQSKRPHHDLENATTFKDAKDKINTIKELCKAERFHEELRLGYVAFTRARHHLFCTAAYWGDGINVLKKSQLFDFAEKSARMHGTFIEGCEKPDDTKQDISDLPGSKKIWPEDPIAHRREQFDADVALVNSAQANLKQTGTQFDELISDARAVIAEFQEFNSSLIEIPRPTRMSPSAIISMKKNPEEFAKSIRRPMPRARDQFSDRGTAFHLWVEKHLTDALLFSDEDLDGLSPFEDDTTLEELKKKWLASEFGTREVHKVEVPFETMIAGILVRGRIDAIYKTSEGYEVVDWKTGSKQLDDDSAIQLAIYRLAWAKLQGIAVESVSAAFHYVPTSVTDRRSNLLSEEELIALLS